MSARAPIRIRASSFSTLFDCPSRWIAINLEGLRVPSTHKAVRGSAIHAGTAAFDRDRVAGLVPSTATAMDAAAHYVETLTGDVDWSESTPGEVVDVATALTRLYCDTEAPKHEYVAVEATIDSLIIADLGIELTGTTDRVEVHPHENDAAPEDRPLGIDDIKSGGAAVGADGTVRTQGHAAQMGVYELIAGAALGRPMTAPARIIGLQTGKTARGQRVGVGEIEGAREVLLGNEDHPGLLTIASKIVHGEMPAWGNPNSMMCNPRYCGRYQTCFFRR